MNLLRGAEGMHFCLSFFVFYLHFIGSSRIGSIKGRFIFHVLMIAYNATDSAADIGSKGLLNVSMGSSNSISMKQCLHVTLRH